MSRARDIADLSSVSARLDTVGGSEGALSNRNLIINGAMQVNQRGNQTGLTATAYGTDRFEFAITGTDELVYSLTQDTDVPSGYGFSNSFKYTTTTAESAIAVDEYAFIAQKIEAQNLQRLAYGTSNAKKLTASFWVKSSVTGTFCLGLYKDDTTAQAHNKTYTINSASTWEHKTITFEANTLSGGAIADDNGLGFYVTWHLAAGSNYDSGSSTSSGWANYTITNWCEPSTTDAVITTLNATFQLTGVQLEVGDTATDFEHRTYGDELARCQRYFNDMVKSDASEYIWIFPIIGASVQYRRGTIIFPVEMRAAPSLVNGAASVGGGGSLSASGLTMGNASESTAIFTGDLASGDDSSYVYVTRAQFDAEL